MTCMAFFAGAFLGLFIGLCLASIFELAREEW